MKYKKIVSKILACAMVVTTVFTGNTTTADAAAGKLQPVAKYDFETEGNYQDIQKITGSLEEYTGDFNVADGGHESGKAFSTALDAAHCLKLPQKNLTDYTVSLWIWNQYNTLNAKDGKKFAVMSFGTPERHVTLKVKDGGNDRFLNLYNGDTLVEGDTIGVTAGAYWANAWRMLTITQSGDTVKVYLEGEKKAETTVEGGSLLTGNGSILIGAQQIGGGNTWSKYDDISVYDVALNDTEVMELFTQGSVTDSRTPDKILEASGITVSPEDGTLLAGKTMKVEAVLPSGVAGADGLTVSYASSDANVATVDANTGVVTGVKKGTAEITATAAIGTVSKTAKMNVTVMATPEEILQEVESVNVSKNITCAIGGTGQVEVELPTGLTQEDVTISYKVSPDDAVASVDNSGKVTAKTAGRAQVITSVTAGQTTRTGITDVWVKSAAEILDEKGITVTPNLKITGTARRR